MTSEADCTDLLSCIKEFLLTAAMVIGVLLVGLLPLPYLLYLQRKKTDTGPKGDSSLNHEMTPVTKDEDNLNYCEIAFSKERRKPKQKNPEDDIEYAQIKNHQNSDVIYKDVKFNAKGKKPNKRQASDDTTYAEIKLRSHQSPPQDGSTDLYACVNKKKTDNVYDGELYQ